MTRVAVLGGTGFIGRHVTRWLREGSADVTTIQRGTGGLVADRTRPAELAAALTAAAPAVLVDMIAYTRSDAESLLAALPGTLQRIVAVSSEDVYWTYGAFLGLAPAAGVTAPLGEDAMLRDARHPYRARAQGPGDRLYDYDKIDVEETLVAGAGVPVTVLRLPMVYGPGDPQRRVAAALERLGTGADVLRLNAGEAGWRCTRGYVEDVAWAIGLAALDERSAGLVFNVGEPDALTELEWLAAVARAADRRSRVVADPAAPPSLPAHWEVSLLVDTGRIRAVLGYQEPVGREEGLRRSVAA